MPGVPGCPARPGETLSTRPGGFPSTQTHHANMRADLPEHAAWWVWWVWLRESLTRAGTSHCRHVHRCTRASPARSSPNPPDPPRKGIEAITADERAAYWSRAWRVLCEVGAEQETYRRETDPVGIYLAALRAVISSKRAHVAARDGSTPDNPVRWGWTEVVSAGIPDWRPGGELVGWVDGDNLYLDPDEALKLARQFADVAGQPLTVSKTKLHDSLYNKHVLASVETGPNGRIRKTTRHDLGGKKGQRVLHLTVTKFDSDDEE